MDTKITMPAVVPEGDDATDPSGAVKGSVSLRGMEVALASDVGAAFVTDCARHLEGALSDAEIKDKWGLSDDELGGRSLQMRRFFRLSGRA